MYVFCLYIFDIFVCKNPIQICREKHQIPLQVGGGGEECAGAEEQGVLRDPGAAAVLLQPEVLLPVLLSLTHFYPPLRFRNQVPTCAVRETDVSRTANVGTVGKNGLSDATHKSVNKFIKTEVKLQI